MNKRDAGSRYETYAAVYLEERGYRILERNFRSRAGEIDLIGKDGMYLVFGEVKYRKNGQAGHPEESVDARKQGRIFRAAQNYLSWKKYPQDTPCRFDVLAVEGTEVRLIKNAFGGLA